MLPQISTNNCIELNLEKETLIHYIPNTSSGEYCVVDQYQ